MVEAFVAEHNISMNEVLHEWPSTKFEAFYEAFSRRKAVEELRERRSLELAAVWGNPNYDPTDKDKEIRQRLAKSIDDRFSKAISMVYGESFEEEEDEIDWDDPFYAAAKNANKEKEQIKGVNIENVKGGENE